jgi:hypothetical protein
MTTKRTKTNPHWTRSDSMLCTYTCPKCSAQIVTKGCVTAYCGRCPPWTQMLDYVSDARTREWVGYGEEA